MLVKLAPDYPRTVFVDLGCGKGRTLLLASHYAFRSIIGVEISPELCQIATENVKAYLSNREQISQISVVCAGINEFEYDSFDKEEHLLVYLYNPCGESVLAIALQKLQHLASKGLWITIIYLNPTCLEIFTTASWLQEIRRGETFDDLGSGFEPYVVFRSLTPPWKEVTEALDFQLGPWVLASWRFASLSNTTSPVITTSRSPSRPLITQPTTYQQMRDDGTISQALSIEGKTIRYVPYRGKRYFVDLSASSFDNYLAKFSGKTRNTLKRKVRHFAERSGGTIDLRYYTSPNEMIEFRFHALAISLLTYQRKIGWAFPETEEFKAHIIEEAEKGRVCGFLLMHEGRPVSYAFCRTTTDSITYAILGYDPASARYSPGIVLLFLVLERLFAERRFRVLDFGGHEWGYKALFATGSIDYLKVIWFPITFRNLIVVVAHYSVRQAWRGAAWIKTATATCIGDAKAAIVRRFGAPDRYADPHGRYQRDD